MLSTTSSSSSSLRTGSATEQLQVIVMRAELAALIERRTGCDGVDQTAIPRLMFVRASCSQHPVHTVYEPAFCVLAQGSKRVLLGDEVYLYDRSRYLIVAQNLPVSGQVIDGSAQARYLGLRLDFDVKDIAALALNMKLGEALSSRAAQRGLCTGELCTALLEPLLRLVRLLDTPADVPALAPLICRELLYRLLKPPEGWRGPIVIAVTSHGADGHRGQPQPAHRPRHRRADAALPSALAGGGLGGRDPHERVLAAPALHVSHRDDALAVSEAAAPARGAVHHAR